MSPALPGGAPGADVLTGDRWSVASRLSYAFVPYDRLQEGQGDSPNPGGLGVDVHLGAIQATGSAPTGTSVDVQLPFGTLVTRLLDDRRRETAIGDLELRVRQAWRPAPGLELGAVAGLVLPTGPYVERSGAANLPPEASYLTLGRGVAWWLAEADARLAMGDRATGLAQVSGRGPLARTSDDFSWGPELRTTVGARLRLPRRISATAVTDLQWRGGATEPDPFSAMRLDTVNAGGWQWTATASAGLEIRSGLSVTVGVRVPLVSDVAGRQLVPGVGGFVAVGYQGTVLGGRRPGAAPSVSATPVASPTRAVPGKLTVVDYSATWCAPCVEIARDLAAAAPGWPDVAIVVVDLSEVDDLALALPTGAAGLPVIEIYDATGVRVALLLDREALRVVDHVETLRQQAPGRTPP